MWRRTSCFEHHGGRECPGSVETAQRVPGFRNSGVEAAHQLDQGAQFRRVVADQKRLVLMPESAALGLSGLDQLLVGVIGAPLLDGCYEAGIEEPVHVEDCDRGVFAGLAVCAADEQAAARAVLDFVVVEADPLARMES
jgi:hypothetical protein